LQRIASFQDELKYSKEELLSEGIAVVNQCLLSYCQLVADTFCLRSDVFSNLQRLSRLVSIIPVQAKGGLKNAR
jgi:hypothetical protein